MKILFSIFHPGFVRHFERALGILCDEGHSVHIAFHNEKVSAEEWTRELREASPQITLGVKAPRRYRRVDRHGAAYPHGVRLPDVFRPRYAGAHRLRANAARGIPRSTPSWRSMRLTSS